MAISILLTLLGIPMLEPLTRHPGNSATAQTDQSKPNIVIIQFDDMRATDWDALPRTKELLGGGTWFENYFVTTPLCCPSRASVLTGLYSHNHGVRRNDGPNGGWQAFRDQERDMLARWLQREDYRTGLIGKYFNGFTTTAKTPPGWDRMYATTELPYYNFGLNENGKWVSYKKKKGRPQRYVTDVLKSKAVKFIRGTGDDTPLFLNVGMRAPHAPATPAKRHRNLYKGAKAKKSAAFNEHDVSDKPRFIRNNSKFTAKDVKKLDALERKRLQSLAAADQMVEAIVDTLAAEGRLDNTYIFVMSDNGMMMGEHRMKKKGAPYDMSARIPMIAWGPEFSVGLDNPDLRLVANIDIAPTIIQVANLDVSGTRDGMSLLANRSRSALLLESSSFNRQGFQAIRTLRYLYVEYGKGDKELYDWNDVANRPELKNIAGTGVPAEDALRVQLDDLVDCAGAQCYVED